MRGLVLAAVLASAGAAHAQGPDPAAARRRSLDLLQRGIDSHDNEVLDGAVALFREAITADPGNHRAHYELGRVHRRHEHWAEASDAYARAWELAPQASMYAMWTGITQMDAGRDGSAALSAAVQLEPRLFRAHWYLGRHHAARGDAHAAALAWTAACRADPAFGPAAHDLAALYLRWGDHARALRVIEASRSEAAEDRAALELLRGQVLVSAGRDPEAVTAFTRTLELRADMPPARLQRGLALARLGRKPEALADLQDVMDRGYGMVEERIQANAVFMKLRDGR